MEKIASQLMGEEVNAGVVIASRGFTKGKALGAGLGGLGGAVGGAIAGVMSGAKSPTTPGGHNGLFYMAVGPTKLAFFSVKQGWVSQSIDKLLAVHLKRDVADLQVDGGIVPKISILLEDGTNYEFECGRLFLGKVKSATSLLGKA
jgi:hypothetical protein